MNASILNLRGTHRDYSERRMPWTKLNPPKTPARDNSLLHRSDPVWPLVLPAGPENDEAKLSVQVPKLLVIRTTHLRMESTKGKKMLHKNLFNPKAGKIVKRHNRPFLSNASKLENILSNSKTSWSFEAIQDELGWTRNTLYELCDYINYNSDTKYVLPQPKPTVRPATVTPQGHVHLPNTLMEELGLTEILVPGSHPICKLYGKGVLILPEEETAGDVPATAESVQCFDDEAQAAEETGKDLAPTGDTRAVPARAETVEEADVIQTSTRQPQEAPNATGSGGATGTTVSPLADLLAQALTKFLSPSAI